MFSKLQQYVTAWQTNHTLARKRGRHYNTIQHVRNLSKKRGYLSLLPPGKNEPSLAVCAQNYIVAEGRNSDVQGGCTFINGGEQNRKENTPNGSRCRTLSVRSNTSN